MSIESAYFAVQRNNQLFKCRGDELADKLQEGDLLTVQRGDTTSKFTIENKINLPSGPWDDHDGGVYHLLNPQSDIDFFSWFSIDVELYDLDGNSIPNRGELYLGQEFVLLAPADCVNLFGNQDFRPGMDAMNWEFGPITNTSKVTNMDSMFAYIGFDHPSISYFDTSNVTNMDSMFRFNFDFNQDISNWNTSKVTSMEGTFYSTELFNQDLSQWCVTQIPAEPQFFADLADSFEASNHPVWGTCPRGEA